MGQSRKRIGGDGKARYTAYYDDVTGRRRSAGTFASRRDADRAWQRAEADTAKGRHTDSGRSRQLFARYVEDEWFPNHQIELTTRQNYRYVLDKHILPVFGGYKMIAILPADIRAWITTLKDNGVKPATVKHCLAVLSAIFTTAFNDQITMLNPCAGIKAPTVPPATRRIITPDQFAAIHAALPDRRTATAGRDRRRDRAALGRTRRTPRPRPRPAPRPARRVPDRDRDPRQVPPHRRPVPDQELPERQTTPPPRPVPPHPRPARRPRRPARQPADLLFPAPPPAAKRDERADSADARHARPDRAERRRTHLPARHHHRLQHGTLPLPTLPRRLRHLPRRTAAPPAPTQPERVASPDARPLDAERHISRTWFRRQIWEPALAQAGLPFHVRVHDLRHAHASWLLAGGADLQAVKDRMGHARLTTTEQYLHTLPHADAATITALDTIRNRTRPAKDQQTSGRRVPRS